jgi:CRP-like cAMP-binding protein
VHRAKWQRFPFGHALYKKGQAGGSFHILAQGSVDVFRDGRKVAQLGQGTSVGEMAYLAPSEDLKLHRADVIVSTPCTTVSFTPETLGQLSPGTRHRFDDAFIKCWCDVCTRRTRRSTIRGASSDAIRAASGRRRTPAARCTHCRGGQCLLQSGAAIVPTVRG